MALIVLSMLGLLRCGGEQSVSTNEPAASQALYLIEGSANPYTVADLTLLEQEGIICDDTVLTLFSPTLEAAAIFADSVPTPDPTPPPPPATPPPGSTPKPSTGKKSCGPNPTWGCVKSLYLDDKYTENKN